MWSQIDNGDISSGSLFHFKIARTIQHQYAIDLSFTVVGPFTPFAFQ